MSKVRYWEKDSTRNELIDSLERQKLILSSGMVEYLRSLIELEFSVLKNEISAEEREAISDFSLYKKIAMYNIYNRALNIVKETTSDYRKDNSIFGDRGLRLYLPAKYDSRSLFDYSCFLKDSTGSILDDYMNTSSSPKLIGDISLFSLESNTSLVIERRDNIRGKLKEFKRDGIEYNLDYYYELIQKLNYRIKNGLTKNEQEALRLVNLVHEKLLADYGIGKDDFDKVVTDSKDHKQLVKKYPKITLSDYKHYI